MAAAQAVEVVYEPLPVIKSPTEGMAKDAIQIHNDQPNLCYSQPQIRGDAEAALAQSAFVVESDFSTQMNHQAPLEPEACVSYLEEGEEGEEPTLVVIGRSINIHVHLGMLQGALGYENMRYEEAYTGGQFGIKIDITSEGLAGAAALHFRRPVRYIPSLTESMYLSAKRHPFDMKFRLGADRQGKLTALAMDYVVDNGAYLSAGRAMVFRALYMLSGSYYIPAVKALGKLVYTNNPWGSAARGAGPPQANFALESAMDMLAEKIGMDPLEFRLINSLKPGQPKSTGTGRGAMAVSGTRRGHPSPLQSREKGGGGFQPEGRPRPPRGGVGNPRFRHLHVRGFGQCGRGIGTRRRSRGLCRRCRPGGRE